MKPIAMCGPCTLNTAYRAIKLATSDPGLQMEAMAEALDILTKRIMQEAPPTKIATEVFRAIHRISNNPDPYRNIKKRSNELALELATIKRKEVENLSEKEKFRQLILASIAGNVIDFGVGQEEVNLNALSQLHGEIVGRGLAIDDFEKLFEILARKPTTLYVADNAGEIAFDKLLLEFMSAKGLLCTLVVKTLPIANDATLEDAVQVGIQKFTCKVITTGSNAFGIDFEETSREFLDELKKADLIISKGQSNFESFYGKIFDKPVVIMLRTKCEHVAAQFGLQAGQNVLKVI